MLTFDALFECLILLSAMRDELDWKAVLAVYVVSLASLDSPITPGLEMEISMKRE